MHATLIVRSALACLLAAGLATSARAQPAAASLNKPNSGTAATHPNTNAPRLPTEQADNSGAVNADPKFVADREAIVNHITAYSHLIDDERYEDWLALFSDDVEFVVSGPELGTVTTHGKKDFKELAYDRYVKPTEQGNPAVRRHTMGNVHVVAQTATTAKARAYMLISTVPNADRLNILTTGVYHANLEKRDGKWTITRWYIETDAPLNPSKLPAGATYVPDPKFVIPGAADAPLKGLISIKNHPYSIPANGPMYDTAPAWFWKNIDVVIVDYLTTVQAAVAMLPENVTTFPVPDMPGYSAAKQVWAHYEDSSFGPYNEMFVLIPCLYKGEMYLYNPFIYVDNDKAMAGGREIGGWPKKLADIKIERYGGEFRLALDRGGVRVASASVQVGSKLFSTPLPADKPINMGFPYSLTFPLPAPNGKPQESVALPTMTLKLIPGIGAERPEPALAQLIGAPWKCTGDFYGGSGSVAYTPSESDPLHKLPSLKVLDAMYFRGKMTLSVKEMKVLEDLLKK
jgi:acetoacetate decarboxylase/3-phenylpropionate/cinnamic acid dioxygenase small subunit